MSTPSSVRYFYRDPLADAWMAQAFGMRFTIRDGVYVPTWQELASSGNADGYFIHPDSLPLLKPKNGDICSHHWYSAISDRPILIYRPYEGQMFAWKEILQRDGKPFHWPESEEA